MDLLPYVLAAVGLSALTAFVRGFVGAAWKDPQPTPRNWNAEHNGTTCAFSRLDDALAWLMFRLKSETSKDSDRLYSAIRKVNEIESIGAFYGTTWRVWRSDYRPRSPR